MNKELRNQVANTDILEVASLLNIKLPRSGGERVICPLCNHKEMTFANNRNKYKCWRCGSGGRGLDLYMKVMGMDYITATDSLARNIGRDITDSEVVKAKKERKEKKVEISNEDINLIHDVYNALCNARGVKLSVEHKKMLQDRNISDLNDFFTIGFGSDFTTERVLSKLKGKYSKEDIAKVPGFYIENNVLKFVNYKGLGLLARDAKGNIVGVQIRNNSTTSKQKYFWLSSTKFGGNGSCPINVEYPRIALEESSIEDRIISSNTTLFITEGKFKAIKIAETFNSSCIALPGVNTWRDKVKTEVDYIVSKREIRTIMLAFDADANGNFEIEKQPRMMMQEDLKNYLNLNIRVAVWNSEYGKGLDDVINNGHRDKLKSIPASEYWEKYSEFRATCEEFSYNMHDHWEQRVEIYNKLFNL